MAIRNETITATIAPVMVPLTSLTVSDDIANLPLFDAVTILQFSVSARAYTSGTYVVNLKNNAGTVLATLNVTASGVTTAGSITVPAVAKSDRIRIGISGAGVGGADFTVTIWMRVIPQSI